MEIVDIIQKKVNKKPFNQEDINTVIKGIVEHKIPDYLITTWLMAVYINGLSTEEAYLLTKAMWTYSDHIDLRPFGKDLVDKHSTGGIGDKVSLILLPIIASCGLGVAKISGRGLGFTGGTIDKLESVGVKTNLTVKEMISQLKKHHIFLSGQSASIAPADKALYHLRDVTGTVSNYGLIASSILSKKFSILGTHVFLDVKYGSGAFCPTYKSALQLIKYLKAIAKRMGRKLTIMVSGMSQPLGRNIGNAIEVLEAQDFLSGNVDYTPDLKELIYKLACVILISYNKKLTQEKAWKIVDEKIKSGQALNKFYEWIESQGGNLKQLKSKSYWHPKYKYEVKAPKAGYLTFVSNSAVGMMSTRLGAGRILKTDNIDPQAGLWWHFKSGEKIKKGQIVVTCFSSKPINAKEITKEFNDCCKIVDKKPSKLEVVRKVIYDHED